MPRPPDSAPPVAAVGLPVGAAAERLGVTASTLRSWERRYGLGPTGRTSGGHRRYTAGDLVVLSRLRELTAAGVATGDAAQASVRTAVRAAAAASPSLVARFAAASEALDSYGTLVCAERAVARHGPARAWIDVFLPVLRELGSRWQHTGEGIEREHVATDAVEQVFQAFVRRHIAPGRRSTILGVAAPNEAHVLPLRALSAAVAAHDIASTVLPALPRTALNNAVTTLRPAALVLWAQANSTADVRLLRGLAETVPAVYVGGPGWRGRRLPERVTELRDLDAAVATMRTWS